MKQLVISMLLACLPTISRADSPATFKSLPATRPASLFDPARHMHVAEVKPGMTGFGLTVFEGTKIEKFPVEVISILRNFNPQYDVVLIRCKDARLEHTGSIQGMSGSPIFLKDASGRERMIGAFAYGWPLSKDPIAGVQPIEYMLDLPPAPASSSNDGDAASKQVTSHPGARGTISWSPLDAGIVPRIARHRNLTRQSQFITRQTSSLLGNAERTSQLQPLSTPLMAAGLPAKLLDQLAPTFQSNRLLPLQTGGAASGRGNEPPAKLEPGSVLAVPLLTGDLELTAIGTCTEVLGDRVWGFGHPFNNEGRVSLPMASGRVNGIIPSLQLSFKLGALDEIRGTLTTDASVGVSGREGKPPPMIPIEIRVSPADGSEPRVYHFQSARHPKLTPAIAGAAFAGALSGSSELPQYNTIDYDLTLSFANGQSVRVANRAVNGTPPDIFADAVAVMQSASENPFERVMLQKITGTARVSPEAHGAQVLDVHLAKSKYRPGEVVNAFVTYQPFHAEQATIPVEMELPRDLRPGAYQLVISDAERYFNDVQVTEPFRLSTQSIEDVFSLLKDITAIRENALYVRMMRQPDGVAVGRTAMPRLPSSRREVMLGAGRSDTTAFVSSTVKVIPTDLVMTGSAEFTIRVEAGAKVAVGGANAPSRSGPSSGPPSKGEEPRKVPGKEPAPKETGGG